MQKPKIKSPRMADGYSDEYKKLGVSEKEYIKFRGMITLVGVPAFFLAFASGSALAFFLIIGAYCYWVWSKDPAEQIPRQRKVQKEKDEFESAIREDERRRLSQSLGHMMQTKQIEVRKVDYDVPTT